MEIKILLIGVYLFLGAGIYGFTVGDDEGVKIGLLLSYLGLWPFIVVAVFVAATSRVLGAQRRKQ